MYVLLRRDGLALNRIHSDRAREFTSPPIREWAAARDIFVTTSESLTPQQNGRAESVVRCLKQRARTLLRAASLPRTLWPAAMTFASEYQRRAALGLLADSTPPFGTVVHCRSKVFGVGGHHDLNEKWLEGRFVGWSEDVVNGHVVKLDSGGYITTAHVRPFLVDSDQLVAMEPYEAHVPVPERRVRGKTTLRPMAMVTPASNPMEDLARALFDEEKFAIGDLLRFWEEASANAFPKGRQCYHGANPRYVAFGQYTHGMFSGLMSSTYRYPYTVQYLTRCFEEFCPYDKFATITVSEDVGMVCHRDVHNERDSYNVVLPLMDCDGGGLWIESDPGQFSLDDEWRPIPNGEWRRGQVHQLRAGTPIRFSARKWHQTEPWQGRRVVLIAYTPRMGALQKETYDELLDLGFNPPAFPASDTLTPVLNMIDIVPDPGTVDAVAFHGREQGVKEDEHETASQVAQTLQTLQEDIIDRFQERAQHLRELLAEEEVIAAEFAQIGSMAREEVEEANSAIQDMLQDVQRGLDRAVEVADAKFLKMAGSPEGLLEDIGDIEEYLSGLPGDLGTTITVPLEQVKENLPIWIPAISKELHNVEETTQALKRIPMQRAKALEREGRLKLVPGKLVFTVKPPAEPSRGISGAPRWKRKARLVICGNFIDPDASMNLFATGASAESLRVALRLASKACWSAGCTDITGAFLLAIWPADKPTYGVLAPRILVRAGLARDDEVFLVCRPLYGLREAPALWAQFRSEKLAALKVPFREGFLVLKSVVTDSELWRIMFMDAEGELTLCGLLVTYVDDLLYLCLKCVMEVLHQAVKAMWPCSALEFAAQGEGVRYLGMELYERDHGFLLGQSGYIETLLKSHGMSSEAKAQLPCPKEWLGDEDAVADVENFSETELRQGQRIVGECLWLAFRTRPDLVFVTNYMASLVSKRPCFVYRIGLKVLSYLNATSALQLRVDGRSSTDSLSSSSITHHPPQPLQGPLRVELRGFSDASFAPFGTRSFGCCLAVVGQTPVAWKASRRPYVTLSVCEAELVEGSNCALLLETMETLLRELGVYEGAPTLCIDNTAAGGILAGSPGSWRTRHLRVRFSYAIERVTKGLLHVEHTPGDRQLADLPTKLHSRARLLDLLQLWNMQGLPELDQRKVMSLVTLTVVLCAMLAVQSLAVEAKKATEKEPLEVAGAWELSFVLMLSCCAAVACWEVLKFVRSWCARRLFQSERSRNLQRLRDLARLAAEAEIDRCWSGASENANQCAHERVQQAVDRALGDTQVQSRGVQTDISTTARDVSPPREPRVAVPQPSPTSSVQSGQSEVPSVQDEMLRQSDRGRLAKDMVMLMTVENIKQGLRSEGLSLSGLKPELAARLAVRLVPQAGFEVFGRVLPTDNQMRYVLWLWQHRRLQMRCNLVWQDLATRETISRWIHRWKET